VRRGHLAYESAWAELSPGEGNGVKQVMTRGLSVGESKWGDVQAPRPPVRRCFGQAGVGLWDTDDGQVYQSQSQMPNCRQGIGQVIIPGSVGPTISWTSLRRICEVGTRAGMDSVCQDARETMSGVGH
jgi:hypothetical protein